MFAKFRPPLLKQTNGQTSAGENLTPATPLPQAKRRKICKDGRRQSNELDASCEDLTRPPKTSALRGPLIENPHLKNTVKSANPQESDGENYYNVLWRKPTAKKHKTWDGDGILHVKRGCAYLEDVTGREMGKTPCDRPLLPGSLLSMGGKEVEIDSLLAREQYLSGRSFLKISNNLPPPMRTEIVPNAKFKPESRQNVESPTCTVPVPRNAMTTQILGPQGSFKAPLLKSTVMPKTETKMSTPRHDPTAEGALVMKRPKAAPPGKQLVDVVVDPLLSQSLRKHQREGVSFLYECVMGLRDFEGNGAILGDEMGLGKTLQTIALLWTLMKQNPIDCDPPVVKKALIVCPVTLVNNWRKEFRKWLGLDRLGIYVFDDGKKRITDFTRGRAYQVMIIGYEKLRAVIDDLKRGCHIDIVIADEGHRLKTAKNKSAQAIKSLDTPRRVVLSGTPIQNDLSEFFMMVDLVNPGLLGTLNTFTKQFEGPIVKSRQPGALSKDVEKGEARSEELASTTSPFILRRTADILSKYLPVKTEYVLMCRPTAAQASVYQHVLACPAFQSALGNSEAALQLITILKKVCNSPWLLNSRRLEGSAMPEGPLTSALLASVPSKLLQTNQGSTKLRALDRLLFTLKTNTNEKIVLVSNYTSTLQILESLLTTLGYPYRRLDGSTPSNKRQGLVDEFNHASQSTCFAFLLSAKAGGLGLNLIGASRLILFDVDWNPATDLQAMARIHRDGQKRPCVIYRFLMAGGIDEKIWQRQVTKLGLASNIMDQKSGSASFSKEDLKDLFRLDTGLSCQTHDLLGCRCGGRGLPETPLEEPTATDVAAENSGADDEDEDLPDLPELVQANKLDMEEQERKIEQSNKAAKTSSKTGAMIDSLMSYSHIDTSKFATEDDVDMEALIGDEVLLSALKDEDNSISFVFAKASSKKEDALQDADV